MIQLLNFPVEYILVYDMKWGSILLSSPKDSQYSNSIYNHFANGLQYFINTTYTEFFIEYIYTYVSVFSVQSVYLSCMY